MKVYLIGPPISTKKHPLGQDVGPQTKETVNAALFSRAMQLHDASPSGFDSSAHTLKLRTTCSQLRDTTGGYKVILCWVWLSDGSAHRAAWILDGPENALYRSWRRLLWTDIVMRERRRMRQRRAS